MDFRGVLGICLTSGAIAVMASCSAADPSTINFSERPKTDPVGTSSGSSGSGDGGSSGTTDGGGGEGGADSGGTITAFSGAAQYDATMAAAQTGSKNAGHTFTNMDPIGQDCSTCHKAGGSGPEWGFASSIYNSSAGTAALTTHAEVRITDPTGKVVGSAYSDELGNFWTDAVTIPAGSHVGVRNATKQMLMSATIGTGDGACGKAGCHVTGGQGKIYLAP